MYLYQVEKKILGLMVKPYSKQKDFNQALKELSKYIDGFSLKYFDSIILDNTKTTEKYMMVKYNPKIRHRLRDFLKGATDKGIIDKKGKFKFKVELTNGNTLNLALCNEAFKTYRGIKAHPENNTPYGVYYKF